MDSVPVNSGLDPSNLANATTSLASFEPDVAGYYGFTLVAGSPAGGYAVEQLAVEVEERDGNGVPSADAGEDQVEASESLCFVDAYGVTICPACAGAVFTLDGTGSADPDGDALTWFWGTSSSGSFITTPAQAVTTITTPPVTTTQGVTTTTTITAQLFVSDCLGAVSLDTVTLESSCTGL